MVEMFNIIDFFSSWSRVQQITGVTNSMQRRSGNFLPPPADDYSNNTSAIIGKQTVKTSSNVRPLAFGGTIILIHSLIG